MSTPFSLAKMVPPMGLTASGGASMPSRDVAFVSRAYKRGAGKKRRWTEEHHWWFGMCFMLVINHPLDILMGHISFYFFSEQLNSWISIIKSLYIKVIII